MTNELQGLCGTCGWPTGMMFLQNQGTRSFHRRLSLDNQGRLADGNSVCDKFDPVWFLSSEQMKIILDSIWFQDWHTQYNKLNLVRPIYDGNALVIFLRDEPISIAKILQDKQDFPASHKGEKLE